MNDSVYPRLFTYNIMNSLQKFNFLTSFHHLFISALAIAQILGEPPSGLLINPEGLGPD